MSVLDRSELEQSHLADLHAIASELGIEGYRRLSRDALIDAILAGDGGQGGDEPAAEEEKPAPGRRRGLRLRRGRDEEKEDSDDHDDGAEVVLPEGDDSESTADEPKAKRKEEEKEPEDVRSGVLDILPGGSGFMREDAFVHAREDVYVSPAQIRRCELRAGDELSGRDGQRPARRGDR
jgi:transcription termination factor Rho